MSNTKSREFLLVWDSTMANPNGDMLNENRPRQDEVTGQLEASDVRVKRFVREEWINKGQNVLVQTVEEKGKIQTCQKRVETIQKQAKIKDDDLEKYLTDNYPLLYLLDKKMKEKNAPLQLYFKSKIMYKIMKNNLYPYFEKLDSNFDFTNLEYKGSGSSNFTFFFADKVLKIGDKKATFDFPTFYRFNDLIVQKKFPLEKNNLYIEISPKGEAIKLTKADITDIKKDLERASLVIGDNNFESNFALFTDEMNYQGFKDVDGNHKVIDITQSKSYQKKKIKLIDLDYIYHKDDKRISIPKL